MRDNGGELEYVEGVGTVWTPDDLDQVRPESGFTRKSLGRRMAAELDARKGGGELTWHTTTGHRLLYVITPGKMWADPKPPTLRMTPGETADWLGLDRS